MSPPLKSRETRERRSTILSWYSFPGFLQSSRRNFPVSRQSRFRETRQERNSTLSCCSLLGFSSTRQCRDETHERNSTYPYYTYFLIIFIWVSVIFASELGSFASIKISRDWIGTELDNALLLVHSGTQNGCKWSL